MMRGRRKVDQCGWDQRVSEGIKEKKEKGFPKNCWYTCLVLIMCCGMSFCVYTISEIRNSIPSRGYSTPPELYVNEGGDLCFATGSQWETLTKSMLVHAQDALWLGGTDPKHILRHKTPEGTSFRSIWKPQLPISEKHRASAQNEVLFFHVDCLLKIRRTPPATTYLLPTNLLSSTLTIRSQNIYMERNASWSEWKQNHFAVGTAQFMYPKVNYVNGFAELFIKQLKRFNMYEILYHWLGASSATEREIGQRDMIDFICGNWDRSHNQFFVYDKSRKSSEIIYLDHNHLRMNKLGKNPFTLTSCKFWSHSVQNLREAVHQNITQLVLDSLHSHEKFFVWDEELQVPIRFLQSRSEFFLEHVDRCIEKHGREYVFFD